MIYPSIGDLTRIPNTWTGGFVWNFGKGKWHDVWNFGSVIVSWHPAALGEARSGSCAAKAAFQSWGTMESFFQGAPKFRSIHGCCPAPWSIIVSQWLIVIVDRTWYRHRPAELRPITMGNSPINWALSLISLITLVVYPTRSQRRDVPGTSAIAHDLLCGAVVGHDQFPIPKDAFPSQMEIVPVFGYSMFWIDMNRHELVDLAQCASSTPDFHQITI